MDLRTGARVGSYEVLGPLGAGGMGEVYRALDTRLGREVALKVLPAAVSQDPARRARFDREARLLAALNHPGIGAIYGVEESPQGPLLVLELIPGVTLAERIARGPLPINEALSIGRQIAEAVAYAHASGVVHRDLKPANVKCMPDGKVKVLDFGIAKALSPDSGAFSADMSTVTPADTAPGAIIGTPDYMSPEQARAQEADRRTDIWSLGCILYEMLTGRRAFQAQTVADTLAAVLGRYPDWSALPESTPPGVRALLRRCLQRDRDQRVHDMSDVRIEIDDALAATASAETAGHSRRRFQLSEIEIAALGVIVIGSLINVGVLYQSVPLLAGMYAGYGLVLPLPLRIYIGASSNVARLAPLLVALALLVWIGLRTTGRSFPPRLRRALLIAVATAGASMTAAGLNSLGRAGLMQAAQLSVAASAPNQVLERDLAALYIAGGQPDRAIALIDPKGNRNDFSSPVRFGSPGQAFQLAESYRLAGDTEAARRVYLRAQDAATRFDEELTERLLAQQLRWQAQFGRDFANWLPATAELRRLPDLVRAVSQQRLDQLGKARPQTP